MKKKLVTPPTEEPISLAEAKLYLRMDHDNEDVLIQSMVTAAREYCEQVQRRVYMNQQWELYPDTVEKSYTLKHPTPVRAIDSVVYHLADGTDQTLAAEKYVLDARSLTEPAKLFLLESPSGKIDPYKPITITADCGFEETSDMPKRWMQAMYLLMGHWYENREAWTPHGTGIRIPFAFEALLMTDTVPPD